jgi:hypothetical protein
MKLTYSDGLATRKLKINRGDGSFLLIGSLAAIAALSPGAGQG